VTLIILAQNKWCVNIFLLKTKENIIFLKNRFKI